MPFGWEPGDLVPPDRTINSLDPQTFGEDFAAHRDAYDRTRTVDAQWANQADFLDSKLDDFYAKTGTRLDNPMRLTGINDPSVVAAANEKNQGEFTRAGIPYPTQDEIAKGGLDRAIASQRVVGDMATRPTSLQGWVGGLAGDMWATAKDPINIMAMTMAPGGGSVAARALGVGAAFAGGTELSNALTYGYQKQVSPSLTPAQAFIKEPLEAGAQGVAQELGIAGLGAIWRRLTHSGEVAREPLAAQDAGAVAAKAADLKAQQPFPGEAGAVAHEQAIAQTERAILADDPRMLPQHTEVPEEALFRIGNRVWKGSEHIDALNRAVADGFKPNDIDEMIHDGRAEFGQVGDDNRPYWYGGGPGLPPSVAMDSNYGASERRLSALEDHPDEGVRGVAGAMRDSGEAWQGMREAIQRGDAPAGSDITPHLLDAAEAVRRSVDDGRPIMQVIDDGDKFHSDTARAAARMFYSDDEMTKLVSRDEMASRLQGYVDETMRPTPGLREKAESALTIEKSDDISGRRRDEHGYIARDSGGNVKLEAIIKVEGDTARVQDIHGVYDLDKMTVSAGPNELGTTAMKQLIRQFRQDHPEIKTITGARKTGAGPSSREASIPVGMLDSIATPEKIRDQARTAQSYDAARANLERMRETGDNKIWTEENGQVVPSVIDKEMKHFDDMDAMAKALRDACNSVGGAAE